MALSTEKDVVAMPSLRADGKPDQTPGYKVIGEDGKEKAASTFDEFREVTQETVPAPAEASTETSGGEKA